MLQTFRRSTQCLSKQWQPRSATALTFATPDRPPTNHPANETIHRPPLRARNSEKPFSTSSRSAHGRGSMAKQPAWHEPPAPTTDIPKLKVYNSLTRNKEPFYPLDPKGKKVLWYACGPTVYDDSHLGHARNYVTQDVIRRIMSDYFHFDIKFVMNITDVDDKIILAARKQYLVQDFLKTRTTVDSELRKTTGEALQAHLEERLPQLAPQSASIPFDNDTLSKLVASVRAAPQNTSTDPNDAKAKMHLKDAQAAIEALLSSDTLPLDQFANKVSSILGPLLDKKDRARINGRDHTIFNKWSKRFENRFFEDMHNLNVRDPDTVTRVTEYGPQIVEFVKRIEEHGYAYAHEGSVYFDTNAWTSSGGEYARLEPWNRNDKELQADGEGSLSAKNTSFKKSGADFALWKASKAGEPSWESKWGEGRPGWHIECSAMASKVLGNQIDIHSGGIDLAFPHHDNELVQSEAYWHDNGAASKQWVNYFLHMGHLSISGSKMSKSLKNFTTIRQALADGEWTPRSLRVIYLLGAWREGLEITPDMKKQSISWEERVNNFFIKVRDLRNHPTSSSASNTNGTSSVEADLARDLDETKLKFEKALLDSFDTPTAMREISELITAYNSASYVPDEVAVAIGKWITEMVVMFGLDANYKKGEVGWSGIDIPEKAKPFIHPLAALRDQVREQAIKGKVVLSSLGILDEKDNFYNAKEQPYAKALADFQRKVFELHSKDAAPKDYLVACDFVRDTILWDMGIYLEDRENRPALVRPLSASLRQEREEREAKAAEKASAKAKAKAEAEAKEKERLEKGKTPHTELFKTEEYSEWDDEGVPTKDKEGKDVAKAQQKKMKKASEAQKKLHALWLEAQK